MRKTRFEKIKYLIAIIGFFSLFVYSAEANITYERTPNQLIIQSPVNFSVVLDSPADFGLPEDITYWQIFLDRAPPFEDSFFGGCYATSTLSIIEDISLPSGVYTGVYFQGAYDDLCSSVIGATQLEYSMSGAFVVGEQIYSPISPMLDPFITFLIFLLSVFSTFKLVKLFS